MKKRGKQSIIPSSCYNYHEGFNACLFTFLLSSHYIHLQLRGEKALRRPAKSCLYPFTELSSFPAHIFSAFKTNKTYPITLAMAVNTSPGSLGMQASKHHHQAATLIHFWQPSTPKLSTLSSVRSLPAANSSLFSNFEHFLHFPVLIETCGHCFPCCFLSHFHCAKAWVHLHSWPPPCQWSSFLSTLPGFKSCH